MSESTERLLNCEECGNEFSISVFLNQRIVVCPSCGHDQPVDPDTTSQYRLMKRGGRSEAGGGSREAPARGTLAGVDKPELEIYDVKETVKVERAVHPIVELLVFLLAAGGLGWCIWIMKEGPTPEFKQWYTWGSWVLLPLVWLGVLIHGFRISNFKGMMLMLVPPYWVYYAVAELDVKVMRAMVFAVILAIGAEAYYLPKDSILIKTQKEFNAMMQRGHDRIMRPAYEP